VEIVFVTPELHPYSKVGGLADAAAGLAKALRGLDHRVLVVTPRYEGIDPGAFSLARRLSPLPVAIGETSENVVVWDARTASGVEVALVEHPALTRAGVYGPAGAAAYPDNALRFGILGFAALEIARGLGRKIQIVHAHDWASCVALHALRHGGDHGMLDGAQGVLTVHNAQHQGVFEKEWVGRLGLGWEGFHAEGFEFWDKLSLLKAGLAAASRVTTVSPTYAKEIQTPAGGCGLDGRFSSLGHPLVGILNGIDPSIWNPATDSALASRYDAEQPSGKILCKSALQAELGLSTGTDAPLVGAVSRLAEQKGLDLLAAAAAFALRQGTQIAVLGQGDRELAHTFEGLAQQFPGRLAFRSEFDEALAHRIYAGSDFFVVPSRFEPCGLAQLYAMRYGAVPIVRRTGGLSDTVVDADVRLTTGTGFVFEAADADSLQGAIGRAVGAYRDPAGLRALRRRAMRVDLTWERAARMYEQLYRQVIA